MRTPVELRDILLTEGNHLSTRPSMFAHDGRAAEMVARLYLHHLCFLEERDDEKEAIFVDLHRYGNLGVIGPFERTFGKQERYINEVVSVYLEKFHRLGYLVVDRTLSPEASRNFIDSSKDRVQGTDLRRSDIEAILGLPSVVVGRSVSCYAQRDFQPGWVFIDYWTERTYPYEEGKGITGSSERFAGDPLVRSVRIPSEDWDSGLILTLLGEFLRQAQIRR